MVFLGTSDFAVPSLLALAEAGETVALVLTQPDRPRGRGRSVEAPPVKRAAQGLGLPVLQPEDVNGEETLAAIRACAPEFLVVVAYGQLLRRPLLQAARRGALNLHPSLLPRHRGPSPVAWTLLCGDTPGVTTMFLDEGMDSGPVLLQESMDADPEATRGELEERLARAGAQLLVRTLDELRRGTVAPIPQDESQATYSRLLTREMRSLEWTRPAVELRRQVHALSPRPGAAARLGGRFVKILRAREVEGSGPPGEVIALTERGPAVACGRGALVLLEVHPEGKRPMDGAAFQRGAGVAPGARVLDPWGIDGG
ncbi:MAG: methionyl-tRNA formyltransferase [Deferrisomatales bacterium]